MESNKNYYQKAGFLSKLLWRCCGAQVDVLEHSTSKCRTRYSGLGGLVLATGVFASLAGGYAFYIIFQPKSLVLSEDLDVKTLIFSIFFGLCWGLMIFNLDRFIVVTSYSDGTEKITWKEFGGAIPRILMGFVIAITISKPLEIRIFKTEIDNALFKEQQVVKSNYANNVTALAKEQRTALEASIKNYTDKLNYYDSLKLDYDKQSEVERLKRGGPGPETIRLRAKSDKLDIDKKQFISDNGEQYNADRAALNKLRTEISSDVTKGVIVAAQLDGLGKRIDLAHQEGGEGKIFFITLLFMVIELGPIFAKMMMKDGNYEKMLKEYDINAQINSGLIPDIDIVTNAQSNVFSKHPLREENVRQLREKIATQKLFFDKLHKMYEEELLKKVDDNYEQFIVEKDIKVDMMPNFGSNTTSDEKIKKDAAETTKKTKGNEANSDVNTTDSDLDSDVKIKNDSSETKKTKSDYVSIDENDTGPDFEEV